MKAFWVCLYEKIDNTEKLKEYVLPELKINKETVLYDLSYSKDHNQTPFLKWSSQRSEKYFDGFGMLINQAAASFALWTGVEPETNITKLDLIND